MNRRTRFYAKREEAIVIVGEELDRRSYFDYLRTDFLRAFPKRFSTRIITRYIYHPDFNEHFRGGIGNRHPWLIRPFLEEVFSPQSLRKPNQLDDWEDYEYLADILRASLTDPFYQKERLSKESLQIGMDWLLEIAQQLRPVELSPVEATQPAVAGLTWKGTKAELAELGYSLIEAGLIDAKEGERGAALTALGQFFGVNLGKPESHLQTIQKRKPVGSNTPLLDRLKRAFEGFLERREK